MLTGHRRPAPRAVRGRQNYTDSQSLLKRNCALCTVRRVRAAHAAGRREGAHAGLRVVRCRWRAQVWYEVLEPRPEAEADGHAAGK